MKKIFFALTFFVTSFINAQDLLWDDSINGDFTIDSVDLGLNGEINTVAVSGKAGNWTVYMTYYFTNKLDTEGQ